MRVFCRGDWARTMVAAIAGREGCCLIPEAKGWKVRLFEQVPPLGEGALREGGSGSGGSPEVIVVSEVGRLGGAAEVSRWARVCHPGVPVLGLRRRDESEVEARCGTWWGMEWLALDEGQVDRLVDRLRAVERLCALDRRWLGGGGWLREVWMRTSESIGLVGAGGEWIYGNPALMRHLVEGAAGLGAPVEATVHPADCARLRGILEEVAAKGQGQEATFRMALCGGGFGLMEGWVDWLAEVPGGEGVRCILGRDVTERCLGEEVGYLGTGSGEDAGAVQGRRRNLLPTLIDLLPDYIYAKDSRARFILSNLAHARLVGMRDPVAMRGLCDREVFPPELAEKYEADDEAVIRLGKVVLNREEPVRDWEGGQHWVLTTKVPLRDAMGKIVGLVGLSRDITERRRAEDHLRDVARWESVTTLAAGVAHEVKNPLQTILFGVEVLAGKGFAADAEVAQVLNSMRNAASRADGIIRSLRDYAVHLVPETRMRNLNEVICEAMALMRYDFLRAGIETVTRLDPAVPEVLLDPEQFTQVCWIIFRNAIDAMAESRGPGRLEVATTFHRDSASVASAVPGRRSGLTGWVGVDIDDTGPGISKEAMGRVFDLFFTTKPPGKGTGIGLALARRILERHGGMIWLGNRAEGGLRVTLTLPVAGVSEVVSGKD